MIHLEITPAMAVSERSHHSPSLVGFHQVMSVREREKYYPGDLQNSISPPNSPLWACAWSERGAISAEHHVLPFLKQPRSGVDKVKCKKKAHPGLMRGRELED